MTKLVFAGISERGGERSLHNIVNIILRHNSQIYTYFDKGLDY